MVAYMSVRTDVINLNVNINGNKAQKDLNDLRKKAADVKFEMEGLKKGTAEYIAKAKELKEVGSQIDALKKQIGLTSLSQKELIAELNKLKALRGSVLPFSNEFKELTKQIKATEDRLYNVKNGVQGFASFFSKIKDEVKQFGIVAAGYLGFQFITSQFQNIIRGAGKMSDQLADLQRASGLTAEEVKALNEQFKIFDTRTSTETLRNIATIAARLGVGKDDIAAFTKEFDKLVVVLGNSLGDADAAATTLGKILNVFDGKITGDNISKLGNAIVALDQSGVASGGFLADFAQRLSGVSKNANLSLGSLLGLGAAIEETGGRVESGSTAIQKIITSIASDLPKAAKIAGVEVKAFGALFAKAPEEAIIKFAEGLVKNKSSFSEITASFKDAGEEGARVVTTLSNIGNSGDLMRKRIAEANIAIKETGVINEGFALKNETFGATLDKLGKEFNKLVSSPGVTNFLKGAVEGALSFIKALRNLPEFISENRIALLTLVAGIIILNKQLVVSAALTIRDSVAKAYNAVVTRLTASSTGIATAAQAAYITVTNLLTGRITLATAAQRLWNIALSFGTAAIGTILIAAGGLLLLFSALAGKTKELTAAQRAQLDVQAKITELTAEEETRAKSLFNQITKTNIGYDDKKKLLQQLIAINPEYLSGLTLENIKTAEGTKILDNYILKLRQANEEKALQQVIQNKENRRQELESSITAGSVVTKDDKGNIISQETRNKDNTLLGAVKSIFSDNEVQKVSKTRAELKGVNDELNSLYEKLKKPIENTLVPGTGDKPAIIPTGKKDNSQANEFNRIKQEAEKFYKELKLLKERAAIKDQGVEDSEIAAITIKYNDLLERAKKYYKDKALIGVEGELRELRSKEYEAVFKKNLQKRLSEDAAKEYEESLLARKQFADELKQQAAKDFSENKISKVEYEKELKQIDLNETADRVIIANDYAATVKKAAKDVYTFRKNLEEQTTKGIIDENEKRKADAEKDSLAKADRNVLTAKPNSDAYFDELRARLKIKTELELANEDFSNEQILLKNEQLSADLKEIDGQQTQAKIDSVFKYIGYFQEALNSLNQFINNREQSSFNKEKASNDKKKKGYKDQLDNKLISQAQYDKKIVELQEKQDKEERALRRKQAQREKALNIFSAVINTARAIVSALPNIPLSIIAGVLGGLQVAAIASTPLPELAKGDWIRDGKKHSQGGINANIESGEAVISAAAMDSNKQYNVFGTTAQITSALNSQAGGANWAGGAIVKSAKWINERPAGINSALPQILEQGGIVRPLNNTNADSGEGTTILKELLAAQKENTQEIKTMKKTLKAVVVLKEIRDTEKNYETAKAASGM